jgi:hypothetical protein
MRKQTIESYMCNGFHVHVVQVNIGEQELIALSTRSLVRDMR